MPILCGILFGCCCALGVHLWDITAESDRAAKIHMDYETKMKELCRLCDQMGYARGWQDATFAREQEVAMLR